MRVIATGDRAWYAPELAEQIVNRLIARYGPGLVDWRQLKFPGDDNSNSLLGPECTRRVILGMCTLRFALDSARVHSSFPDSLD
jgi:hypothetical protein